jgi:hypothetical protein
VSVKGITGGYKFYFSKVKIWLKGRDMRYGEGKVRISGDEIQKQRWDGGHKTVNIGRQV